MIPFYEDYPLECKLVGLFHSTISLHTIQGITTSNQHIEVIVFCSSTFKICRSISKNQLKDHQRIFWFGIDWVHFFHPSKNAVLVFITRRNISYKQVLLFFSFEGNPLRVIFFCRYGNFATSQDSYLVPLFGWLWWGWTKTHFFFGYQTPKV